MPKSKLPPMRDLHFGRVSARDERTQDSNLVRDAYYDLNGAALRITTGDAWALLGPKGSGKSYVFEYLDEAWANDFDRFVSRWDLDGFPVIDVRYLQVGLRLGPASTRRSWEIMLLLKIVSALQRDSNLTHSAQFRSVVESVRASGILDSPFESKFAAWSKNDMAFPESSNLTASSTMSGIEFSNVIKESLKALSTSSRHVFLVDGLDSFFGQSDEQLESLASLAEAALDINSFLAECGLAMSVVLAVRADMFTQLPSTDIAKLRDHAVELDWTPGGLTDANKLWDLANLKAQVSTSGREYGKKIKDIRLDYLAERVITRPVNNVSEYLLSNTRLLPRDLIALLNTVKEAHGGSSLVSEETAKAAVRLYSETYFISEISNNLTKVLDQNSASKVAAFIEALTTLPSRFFSIQDVANEVDGVLSQREIRALLHQMFRVGGLGVQVGNGPVRNTNFVFRRIGGGGFSINGEYSLHNALVEAWNLNRY